MIRAKIIRGLAGAGCSAILLAGLGVASSQPASADSAEICHAVADNPTVDGGMIDVTGHGECWGTQYADDYMEVQVCVQAQIPVIGSKYYWATFECSPTAGPEPWPVLGAGTAMAAFNGFQCYRTRTRMWGYFQGMYNQAETYSNTHCYDPSDEGI